MDVEIDFKHSLKKRRRRKRKSNLSLNQSRKKKKKFNYGEQVNVKKVPDEVCKTTPESPAKEVSTLSTSFQIDVIDTHEPVQLFAPSGNNRNNLENNCEDVDLVSQV